MMKRDPVDIWLESLSSSGSFERATELNWLAYTLLYREIASNLSSVAEPDHFRIISGEPTQVLNQVSWGGPPRKDLELRVEEITECVRKERQKVEVPCSWFTIGTHVEKNELQKALLRSDWELSAIVPGMTCRLTEELLEPSSNREFLIERVRTSAELDEWLSPVIEGFGFDERSRAYTHQGFLSSVTDENHPFRHYLLSYRGSVISTGSIHFRYGVAVIYNICTLRSAQKIGAATAMVQYLKRLAAEEGYDSVSLFALEAGKKLYEKLGFETNSAETYYYHLG